MTADEFRAWLERRGLNYSRSAPLLAADHTEVLRWAKGERKVPRRIARIVQLLEEKEEIGALAKGWLEDSREMMEPSDSAPAVQVAVTLADCANALLDALAWPNSDAR